MRTARIIIFVGMLALGCISLFAQSPNSKPTSQISDSIPTVDFCDLTVHPKLYVGKLVRVNATFIWWWESSYLYNSRCETDQKKIHDGLDCSRDAECERLSKEVYDHFKHERENVIGPAYRSDVTIGGRLVGPRKSGFGHLGSFKFEFKIRNVESASPVEKIRP
jgi:hypothetical protein